jgi:carboxypeptidase Taq
MRGAYEELIGRVKETALLRSSAAILGWDQRTQMPPGGVEQRSRQLAQLAGLIHERASDPRIGELLDECEDDPELLAPPHADTAANLRELRRGYDRATRLPGALVEEMARTHSCAEHEWQRARAKSDFSLFRPWLERNVELARRQAECFGWAAQDEIWDALAEGYESGMRARELESVFQPLRAQLQALVSEFTSVSAARAAGRREAGAIRAIALPVDAQLAFVRHAAAAIGFDFERGRIDTTAHPFCSGTCPGDVRITTRLAEDRFLGALFATLHEAGHGIYEQGLPALHTGTPLGRAASLGIHESQSRLWENFVGRSLPFWRWCQPALGRWFGGPLAALSAEELYAEVNTVAPSWIRVEADECTYNLHIMIRFELERALLRGDLRAAELPYEWNRRYQEYLGIEVPDDARGCLQDVHWAGGSFGYFPTYTLGNLYAAQFFAKLREEVSDLDAQLERGEFRAIREWLHTRVHAQGSRYRPGELCERVTGKPLSAEPLLRHLEAKLRPLHAA